jgi:PEP-CTERM motif
MLWESRESEMMNAVKEGSELPEQKCCPFHSLEEPMKRKITVISMAPLLCLLLAASSSADVLYDNGAANGTLGAFSITGQMLANSFTLSSESMLTEIRVGVWIPPEPGADSPLTVEWSLVISSLPDDETLMDGPFTASLTNLSHFTNSIGYDVYTSSFSAAGFGLPAGTHWLRLENGRTREGRGLFLWDQTNGPSQAWDISGVDFYGGLLTADNNCGYMSVPPVSGNCSESFQIYGTTIPEPSSLALFGLGLLLTRLLRRKLSRDIEIYEGVHG